MEHIKTYIQRLCDHSENATDWNMFSGFSDSLISDSHSKIRGNRDPGGCGGLLSTFRVRGSVKLHTKISDPTLTPSNSLIVVHGSVSFLYIIR